MVAKKTQSKPERKSRFFGFELFMALFSLFTLALLVDIVTVWFFQDIVRGDMAYSSGSQDLLVFMCAALVVWLPIAVTFYIRARRQVDAVADVRQKTSCKVMLSIFYFINIITMAGAALTALYSIGAWALGMNSSDENIWVTAVIPALVIALWHGYLLLAFSQLRYMRRKLVALVIASFSVVMFVGLAISIVPDLRKVNFDDKREDDIEVIYTAIEKYTRENDVLPASLDAVNIDQSSLENSLSEYTFKKEAAKKYQLCTSYLTDTSDSGRYDNDDYNTFMYEDYHSSGEYCYKQRVYVYGVNIIQ